MAENRMELFVLYRSYSYCVLCHCYDHLYCGQGVNDVMVRQTTGSNSIVRVAGNCLGNNPGEGIASVGFIIKKPIDSEFDILLVGDLNVFKSGFTSKGRYKIL